ncbi:MAG: hypothetical protein HQK75_20210 [Candidatus Magnetomorum sp.]|nr:hypothetical protein [Candidatus Magnetomorum sp.]
MKNFFYRYIYYVSFVLCVTLFIGCGDDEYKLYLTIEGKGGVSLNGTKYETNTILNTELNDMITVTYDASSYDDWEFVAFSGDLTGTANSQKLTMNEDKHITATFQLENSAIIDGYVKNLSEVALNNVIVSSGTSSANQVTTTTSSTGYYQLKNIPVPSDKKIYLTYKAPGYADKTVYAYKEKAEMSVDDVFLSHIYQLTIQNDHYNKGSSAPIPTTYSLTENEITSITAIYADILAFEKWSGDVPSSENAYSVGISLTMDQHRTIKAEFLELTAYSLHVFWNNQQGSVSQNPAGITHVSGAEITVSSTPQTGYNFVHWVNHAGELFDNQSIEITLDANAEYTCIFAAKTNTLALSISGQGIVKKEPDLEIYPPDTKIQLTAIPAQGWLFRKWQGDIDSTTRQITIIMDSTKSFEVVFEKPCASFSGQVTNENGVALSDVLVSSGSQSTATDSNGYFLLSCAELPEEIAMVKVVFQKQGYCKLEQACNVQDQQLLTLSPKLAQFCLSFDLATVINALKILTQQTSAIAFTDIYGDERLDLFEVILMMQYLSNN